MAEKKYEDLVKKLVFQGGTGGAKANAREMAFMMGDKLAGIDMNFILGVYEHPGDWAPGRGSHTHPLFAEYLLFFGYDPEDLNYLGSELELTMGEEWEAHKITTPTIVIAPKELPHCPLVTEKVYKPFGHLHLAMSSKYSGGKAPQKTGSTDGTKYANLFKKMVGNEGPGGADAKQLITINGDQDLEGHDINIEMGLYTEPGQWSEEAHVHPYDEIMVFFGHNTDDLRYLGAEITIEIGKEREKHTFDVATVVSIPKGTPHFPVVCNKVEKPYRMARVGLAAKYESSPVK